MEFNISYNLYIMDINSVSLAQRYQFWRLIWMSRWQKQIGYMLSGNTLIKIKNITYLCKDSSLEVKFWLGKSVFQIIVSHGRVSLTYDGFQGGAPFALPRHFYCFQWSDLDIDSRVRNASKPLREEIKILVYCGRLKLT